MKFFHAFRIKPETKEQMEQNKTKNKYFYNNNTIKMAVMIKVSIMYYNDIIMLRN